MLTLVLLGWALWLAVPLGYSFVGVFSRRLDQVFVGVRSLQSPSVERIVAYANMKKQEKERRRVELGRHIVADPKICGGQPTFKGTRVMVWIVLEQLERGLTWKNIVREWDGRVSEEAIGEAISIAELVAKHEPFRGFNVGAGRKPARQSEALAA